MTNSLGKNEQFSSQRERKWFKVRQKIEVELRRVQECQAADYTQDLSTLMHKCLKSTEKSDLEIASSLCLCMLAATLTLTPIF